MEPEYFQYLLLMLVSIGKARPHNLRLISGLLDSQLAQEMLSQQQDIGPSYSNKVNFFCLGGGGENWMEQEEEEWEGREGKSEGYWLLRSSFFLCLWRSESNGADMEVASLNGR